MLTCNIVAQEIDVPFLLPLRDINIADQNGIWRQNKGPYLYISLLSSLSPNGVR
jgi:hypothetical protein